MGKSLALKLGPEYHKVQFNYWNDCQTHYLSKPVRELYI